jgi:hypothetical protein
MAPCQVGFTSNKTIHFWDDDCSLLCSPELSLSILPPELYSVPLSNQSKKILSPRINKLTTNSKKLPNNFCLVQTLSSLPALPPTVRLHTADASSWMFMNINTKHTLTVIKMFLFSDNNQALLTVIDPQALFNALTIIMSHSGFKF